MSKRMGGMGAVAVIAIAVVSACGGSVTTGEPNSVGSGGSDATGTAGPVAVGRPVSSSNGGSFASGSGGAFTAGSEAHPQCEVAPGAIGCPSTYAAARASVDCLHDSVDSPRFGVCGGMRTFEFGHDGSVTCSYDSGSGLLIGGLSCGIPPFYSAECPCVGEGPDPTMNCEDPETPACPAIELGAAGAGGSAGEGGAAGAPR